MTPGPQRPSFVSPFTRRLLLAAAPLCAWAALVPADAQATNTQTFVRVKPSVFATTALNEYDREVTNLSGGVTTSSQTAAPGIATVAFTTPLSFSVAAPDVPLLKMALPFLAPSSAPPHLTVESTKYAVPAMGALQMIDRRAYHEVVVDRIDVPGTSPTTSHELTLHASVGASSAVPITPGIVSPSSLQRPPPLSATWTLEVDGLPNVGGLRGTLLTYDAFSLTPASANAGVAITMHGKLADVDLAKWSQTHPSGANATIAYVAANGGNVLVRIKLAGVTVASSANDPPKPGATTSTTFTAHLAAKNVAYVF